MSKAIKEGTIQYRGLSFCLSSVQLAWAAAAAAAAAAAVLGAVKTRQLEVTEVWFHSSALWDGEMLQNETVKQS